VIRALNDALKVRGGKLLKRDAKARKVPAGSCEYNVTLINRMEPPSKCTIKLREEPKYDMGLTSVSWHADSSLQRHSTIGMYVAVGAVCPPHAAAGVLTVQRVVNTQLPPNRRPTQLCGLACCIVREQHRQRRRGYARHLCTTTFAAELLHAERLQPPSPPRCARRKFLAVLIDAPRCSCEA